MKKFIFAIIMAVAAFGIQAQDTEKTTKTVTGAVVDDNGNPMPGALVEATGGAESVTTDADGTFTLEVPVWLKSLTATYPGLKPRKVKLHNKFNYDEKVLFEMKKKKPATGSSMPCMDMPKAHTQNIGFLRQNMAL